MHFQNSFNFVYALKTPKLESCNKLPTFISYAKSSTGNSLWALIMGFLQDTLSNAMGSFILLHNMALNEHFERNSLISHAFWVDIIYCNKTKKPWEIFTNITSYVPKFTA